MQLIIEHVLGMEQKPMFANNCIVNDELIALQYSNCFVRNPGDVAKKKNAHKQNQSHNWFGRTVCSGTGVDFTGALGALIV